MRRRSFLAATGGALVGTLGGCLAGDGEADGTNGPGGSGTSRGRQQWGYGPGNADHALDLTGPRAEPSHQHLYTDVGSIPLTEDGVFYTARGATGFEGERRWDSSPPVEGGRLGPAMYGDAIVCAGRDPRRFWAIDRADGSIRWRTELGAHERPSEFGNSLITFPRGPLTVQGDRAFFSTRIGIGCVDLEEREEAWHTDLHEEFFPNEQPGVSPPAATEQLVMTINEEPVNEASPAVYALEPETGDVAWTRPIRGEAWGAGQPVVVGDQVFVLTHVNDPPGVDPDADDHQWVQITAIDAADGLEAWRIAVPNTLHYQVAVGDGLLYVAHYEGLDEPSEISAIDTADGSTAWTVEVETVNVMFTLSADRLYVRGFNLYALDPGTGDRIWEVDLFEELAGLNFPQDFQLPNCPPIVDDGRVFVPYTHGLAGLW